MHFEAKHAFFFFLLLGINAFKQNFFSITFDNKISNKDVKSIAILLSNTFDNDNFFLKWYSILNYEAQLQERLDRLVGRICSNHTMIVARNNNEVVGFIELGLLPLPSNRVNIQYEIAPKDVIGDSSLDDCSTNGSNNQLPKKLYPTVGNIVTDVRFRR